MRPSALIAGAVLAATSQASPASSEASSPKVPAEYLEGFTNPRVVYSAGGKATCIQGTIPVTASTTSNIKFNYPIPANQSVITQTHVNILQINSSFVASINEGPATVSGTHDIFSEICYPKGGAINASSVQMLIHGIGVSSNYWDFAAGYSYVDVAAENGYTTFFYDRLGVGQSDHPDPIQVVQAPYEVAIAHSVVGMLRAGDVSCTAFKKVIAVGHSFGSIQAQALTYQYPADLDAAVLTGYTTSATGQPTFMSALNSAIARVNQPSRFKGLNNGYMVVNAAMGNQFDFFREPYYAPAIFNAADEGKGEYTFGELMSAGGVDGVATKFTGPVDIVNGEFDWPFCQGNCMYPVDQSAAVIPALYPKASSGSQSVIVPGVAHALNLHYNSPMVFSQIQNFVKVNGF